MPWCSLCTYYSDKQFNLDRHLHSHQTGKVQLPALKSPKSLKCHLCDISVSDRDDLIKHLTSDHDVVISTKHFTFENQATFVNWKTQVEKETASRYVLHRGISKSKTHKTVNYYCHRDGCFSRSGTGKRHLKMLGSNKINGCCPARIKAKFYDSGLVIVEFVETHSGHTNDLGRIYLHKNERQEIAAKISAGVPFKDVLKGVRNSVHNDNVDFINLLTSKDLWNIQQEFNLNTGAVRHQNDSISVDSWVRENEGNEVVRFYKQQGQLLASHPELLPGDFILIIANESQLTMLEQFGNDCVCLDGTHGLNQYDFELTTIMVLDELRQGFPCAFMLSNRTDSSVMKIFFSVITAELDSPITPKVFMSDMAEAYRNAWVDVMSPPENFLFCTWHVDKAWKTNLSKVNNDLKKAEVYKTLRTLLEKTDANAFERLLAAALLGFERDPEKKEFGKYFKSEYGGKTRSWAFCYRTYLGLNTNMHLESLHKTIKNCYFEGKKVKRLDKCINVLMRVIRDKLFDRLITCHRGKLTKKLSDIRRRHRAALEMKNVQVIKTDRGWTISSSSSDSLYEIVLWNAECSCNLRCDDCSICLHMYRCDCLDASIKWVICRHIHFMVMNSGSSSPTVLDQTSTLSQSCEGSLVTDDHGGDKVQEVIIKELSKAQDAPALYEKNKNALVEKFRLIMESTRDIDELQIVEKALLPIMPTIEATRSTSVVFLPKRQVNTLKKMSPQKNFFSTKNKKKKTERLLQKPSAQEKIMHSNSLLQQADSLLQQQRLTQ